MQAYLRDCAWKESGSGFGADFLRFGHWYSEVPYPVLAGLVVLRLYP